MNRIAGNIHRERLIYWLQDEPIQNFGDFLTAYLEAKLFIRTPRRPGEYRIIGSCLHDGFVNSDGEGISSAAYAPTIALTAWGAGARQAGGLSRETARVVDVLAVRGPLTASDLGLGADVPIGDPGLLLPALYEPRLHDEFVGLGVCVPHFNDRRTDAEIMDVTGADRVLRPAIQNSLHAIEAFIDALTSARFLLCGSLHAAIAAAAYGKPFGLWDSGCVDLPFKWLDFAASVGIPATFQPNIESGELHYNARIRPFIRLPAMWRSLAIAPFLLRPSALLRILRHELRHANGASGGSTIDDIIRIFEVRTPHLEEIASDANLAIDSLAGRIDDAMHALAERDSRIASLEDEGGALQRQILENGRELQEARHATDRVLRSSSWRLTVPYRALRNLTRPALRAIENSDFLYRAVTSPLLLLPYLAHKGDRHGFYRSWRRNSGFMVGMIAAQGSIHERLLLRGSLYRSLASTGFALAFRIHESGGVFTAMSRTLKLLSREGLSGVLRWLMEAAPRASMAAPCETVTQGVTLGSAVSSPLPIDVGRRILVSDYRIPRADVSAGERATVGILKDLCALGFEVTFLPKEMEPSAGYEEELRQIGVEVITKSRAHETSPKYVQDQGAKFGAFYFIRVDVAETLLVTARRAAPTARIIFHAPDLYFLRETRAAEVQRDAEAHRLAMETKARELAMMSRSDHVVVVSTAEVQMLERELPTTPISVFPVLYAPVAAAPPGYDGRRHIFFLGGFVHTPNVSAVKWFVSEIWPQVRAALPNVEFHIVGVEAPECIVALGDVPGVRFVGFVPDLQPMLQTMRLGVAPLLIGAGIKGKVAMTMGAGIPCVCTTIAAEGMGIENGVHACVADSPGAFAEAVIHLYGDASLWQRLSRSGQVLVSDRFGAAANRAALLEVLDASRVLPLELYCEHWTRAAPEPVPSGGDGAAIDVSIIVPVYNKWHLTRACLNSVIGTSRGCGVSYELIVADDGSSDETLRAQEVFPGLLVIRPASNLGFLLNCNHAARQARGRHIVLLNNDTIVLPGWLKALYQTVEADPGIAIVGSKMLYPDGHIREAGGGLLSDGDDVSIGRWLIEGGRTVPVHRDQAVFNIERDTDYVSGSSLLVRKSFWERVGGFDDRYQPAYSEDADLAMTARAHDMRVVYQPLSEVVHFEHPTYAEGADADQRALMAKNRRLLFDKWKATLQRDHLPPGSAWHLVAAQRERTPMLRARSRRGMGKLNVLYFSPFPSHPGSHGNQATIQQFARSFQKLGHKVHFALLQSTMYGPDELLAMREAWDTLSLLPNKHPLGADGAVIPFDGWYEDGLGERIRVLCARHDIDMVFCSYVFQSKLLEFVPNYILKVIDTHDKMGNRYDMLRMNGVPLEFFSCSPQEEGAYLRRADLVVARREEEARYFDTLTGRKNAVVIPHIEEARFVERRFESVRSIGIVASANRVNLSLLQDCLAAIDKCLAGRQCPFVVHIAGQVKGMVPTLPRDRAALFGRPWVRMRGFVPDIGGFYQAMDLIVTPVTMGTGINVKTVQAMAYGMPLVSTAWGTKGIETDHPLHNHTNLDAMARSLLELSAHPEELSLLAEVSRRRYLQFLEKGSSAMAAMFKHPKVAGEVLPPGAPPAVTMARGLRDWKRSSSRSPLSHH